MFVIASIYALAILFLAVLTTPAMIGKEREPITGGEASNGALIVVLFMAAVYVIWRHTDTQIGTIFAISLWAMSLFSLISVISRVGKPRKVTTPTWAAITVPMDVAFLAMACYLVFA